MMLNLIGSHTIFKQDSCHLSLGTAMNELCPVDSTKNKRDSTTLFNYSSANILKPYSLDPRAFLISNNGFNSDRGYAELYQPAVNVVEQHNYKDYCFRKNK